MSESEDLVLLPSFLTGIALAYAELILGGHPLVAHAWAHLLMDAAFAGGLSVGWALVLGAEEKATFAYAAIAGAVGVVAASAILFVGLGG